MIETCRFTNLRSQSLSFNTDNLPLHDYHIDGETRGADRPHMQDHGDWQSYGYMGPVTVHLEGDIVYDTTENYITARLNMLDILVPPPGRQRLRRWGTLYIKYTGQTYEFAGDCRLDGYPEIPLQALYPSVSPFQVSFHVFEPHFTEIGTGRRVLV